LSSKRFEMSRDRSTIIIAALLACIFVESCQKEYSIEGGTRNLPPVAAAGADQVVNLPADSTILDGRASSDPDGKIVSWRWSRISGSTGIRLLQPDSPRTVVNALAEGSSEFTLTVTDDRGLSDTDTLRVIAQPPSTINRPPVACSGPDQQISLPVNSVTLDGRCSSDADNNITSYLWTKLSGPATFRLSTPNQPLTAVTDLTEGEFVFQLTVSDALGLVSTDTIRVTVSPTTDTDSLDIFLAGNENAAPRYWKNGKAFDLKISPMQNGDAKSITVNGNDIYVAGWEGDYLIVRNNRAKYWKNGEEIFLTGATGAGANAIAVSGNDVYVAGWELLGGVAVAKYWKNGVAVSLTNGTKYAVASGIVVIGDDVYVSGHEDDIAKCWRNGQSMNLPDALIPSYANGLAVVGGDIYLAGSQDGRAAYWKNGRVVVLTASHKNSSAASISISGTNVFVAGQEGEYDMPAARIWKNGQRFQLASTSTLTSATGVFATGNDVFVAGFDLGSSYRARYWRNGKEVILSFNPSAANSIFVKRR
jgi:hypothetical protein